MKSVYPCLNLKKNKDDFNEKYKAAFIEMRSRPYYNEEADQQASLLYYANLPSPPTYDSLNALLFSTYNHAKRRINLFPVVDRQPDGTLRCIYSNQLLEDEGCNRLEKSNEEHCLPQSWHEGSLTHPGADMHQLFASGISANSFRKNLPFGQGHRPVEEKEGGTIYPEAGGLPSVFLPRFNHGACARATLYIFVTYKVSVHPERFSKECLPWLIQTATNEPVTLWEKHRNAELFRLQGNRNPFIDHPEWSLQLDFSDAFSGGYLFLVLCCDAKDHVNKIILLKEEK